MMVKYTYEEKEHYVEVYLSPLEVKRLYKEQGVCVKKCKHLFRDDKAVNFYIANFCDKD